MPRRKVATRYVREVTLRYSGVRHEGGSVADPGDAAAMFRRLLGDRADDPREFFVAVYLDGRHQPIGWTVVAIGTASAALVHPREVFQAAVHIGACALIVAHTHPSGDPSPSSEDRELTKTLRKAGDVLGITLLDHLVLGDASRFRSLRQEGSCGL